jgi:hypothetical protein
MFWSYQNGLPGDPDPMPHYVMAYLNSYIYLYRYQEFNVVKVFWNQLIAIS